MKDWITHIYRALKKQNRVGDIGTVRRYSSDVVGRALVSGSASPCRYLSFSFSPITWAREAFIFSTENINALFYNQDPESHNFTGFARPPIKIRTVFLNTRLFRDQRPKSDPPRDHGRKKNSARDSLTRAKNKIFVTRF